MLETESNELPNTTAALLRRMAGELVCPICLSYYTEPMSTPCLHTYCKACILQSLETLAKCPLCKIPLTKRQLNPMPAITEIVNAFEELKEAYEDETGQALSQEPIRSSQWQMYPDPNLTQKYPYPSKHLDEVTLSDDTPHRMAEIQEEETSDRTISLHSIQSAAALHDQIQMIQPSITTYDHTEELQGELSRLRTISQVEEVVNVDFDDDVTQIPSSQVEYNSGASSPDLSYPLPLPLPAQSTTSLHIPDTYQSTQFSTDIGANPSPDFWHDKLREHAVVPEKMYVILGTHLSHSILSSESRKAVEQLNGTLVDKFTPEVTHVVTSVDETGHARRTLKYLQSIVCGKWILNEMWLEKSILAGKFVPEQEYEVIGDEASDRPSIPSIARQMVQRKKLLFANMKMLLSGSFHGPSREDLAGLIRYGGGQVAENTTEPASDVIIVIDSRSDEASCYDESVNTVITAARILDCISCYTVYLD